MPAFSIAICSMVSPRIFVWVKPADHVERPCQGNGWTVVYQESKQPTLTPSSRSQTKRE
jgi:hypothetical protein